MNYSQDVASWNFIYVSIVNQTKKTIWILLINKSYFLKLYITKHLKCLKIIFWYLTSLAGLTKTKLLIAHKMSLVEISITLVLLTKLKN